MKITKSRWVELGGLRNPHLWRKQYGGRWYYYANPEAVQWHASNKE